MAFLDENAGKVYLALCNRKLRCVSSNDIAELCGYFGFSPVSVRKVLIRKGALVPLLFKGIFYVRLPHELLYKSIPSDPLFFASLACNKLLGKNWYFGLHTALVLNNLAGVQVLSKNFIVTKKQQVPRVRKVAGMEFVFATMKGVPFDQGLVGQNGLRYSTPVRTSLDFLHFGIKKADTAYAEVVLGAVIERGKKAFALKYKQLLKFYSTKRKMRRIIEKHLGGKYHAL